MYKIARKQEPVRRCLLSRVKKSSFVFVFSLLTDRAITFLCSLLLFACICSSLLPSKLCVGRLFWLKQPVSRLFSTSLGAGSWNLFLSKEPKEGLSSATVALTGERRTRLSRGLAKGISSICKNPTRTHRAVRWWAQGRAGEMRTEVPYRW